MSRSNICSFINGNIRSPVQDSKGSNEGHLVKSLHQIVHDKARTFSDSTLVGSGSMTASINRSDCTLTESFSGRYSTNSWGADEALFEKEMAEKVRKKLDIIHSALYNGKPTGNVQVDEECNQWSANFPHLMVHGLHLLDSMDDGTDMIDPDPFLMLDVLSDFVPSMEPSQDLEVVGRHIEPKAPPITVGCSHSYEEVLAADGVIEEFFAFDKSIDETLSETTRHSRLKRNHRLPPLTPNAAVKDTVCNLVFDQIWNETVSLLQPVVTVIRERASTMGRHSNSYALDVSLPPLADTEDSEFLHHQPYILRGLRDPTTLTKAPGPSGAKFLRFKHSSSNLPATLPQVSGNLSGVMQIRSVSLQHRLPSVSTATAAQGSMKCKVTDVSREGTPLIFRPGTSVGSHAPKSNTPLPLKFSDLQLQSGPGARLMSSRVTSRRNVSLKPIDRPKTPAIDSCIRGFKLSTNVSMSSPPSTPFTRNNQLPPLETTLSSVTNISYTNSFEKSPPFQLRTSARDKNRVTFNSRIISAADFQDTWKNKVTMPEDIRPSTTSTSCRQDGPPKSVGRKCSEQALQFYGNMTVVGHAAAHHGTVIDRNDVIDITASKDRFTLSIAEDSEHMDSDTQAFTITGTSGLFKSRPSARGKLRGHVR